jgi:hypothetical protein
MAAPCRTLHTFPNKCVAAAAAARSRSISIGFPLPKFNHYWEKMKRNPFVVVLHPRESEREMSPHHHLLCLPSSAKIKVIPKK